MSHLRRQRFHLLAFRAKPYATYGGTPSLQRAGCLADGVALGGKTTSKETSDESFAELTTEASEFETMPLSVFRTLQVICGLKHGERGCKAGWDLQAMCGDNIPICNKQ